MKFRCFGSISFAALVLSLGGCSKSKPPSEPAASASTIETVARVHWLGKKRLANETNAATFMEIWNLSQSAALEKQTLDKLSFAPWRMLKGDSATNGAPTTLLLPLLDDLVQEESYLEIRAATNQPGELAFAIRLNNERAALWQTNLSVVVESLLGTRPMVSAGDRPGWSVKKTNSPNLVELTRAGDWTLVGLAENQNALFGELLARIKSDHAPFTARTTNFWVEASFDLPRISRALSLGWKLPAKWPRVFLTMIGDGKNVNTRAQLNFAAPLALELEPWNIPTNLIHDPLVSFIAIRGVKPWLESFNSSQEVLRLPAVNQICGWSQAGFPLQTYFAAPVTGASNQMNTLAESLLKQGNAWLTTNGIGDIERSPRGNSVTWTRLPMVQTFLQSTNLPNGGEFIFGGWVPHLHTNQPPPAEMLDFLRSRTNLIAYDWEITQARVEGWLLLNQTLRLALFRAQLPARSLSMAWLKFAGLKLGNSVTQVLQTGPAQITIGRQSTGGLTAMELHLFTDWLESPQFPSGLHSFIAPPEGRFQRRSLNPPAKSEKP